MGLDEELSDLSINPATGSLENWRPVRTCWYGYISHAWILSFHLCHSGTVSSPHAEQSNSLDSGGEQEGSLQKWSFTSDPWITLLAMIRKTSFFGRSPRSRPGLFIKHFLKNFLFQICFKAWNVPELRTVLWLYEPQPSFSDISDAAVQTSLNTKESFLRPISSLECSVLWKVSLWALNTNEGPESLPAKTAMMDHSAHFRGHAKRCATMHVFLTEVRYLAMAMLN